VVGGLAAVGALYLGFLVFALVADRFLYSCRASTYATVPSPRGSHRALVSTETCGTDPVALTRVWISETDPNQRWSAFVAPTVQRLPGSAEQREITVQVLWIGESHLQVSFPKGMEVHAMPAHVRGVDITYRDDR